MGVKKQIFFAPDLWINTVITLKWRLVGKFLLKSSSSPNLMHQISQVLKHIAHLFFYSILFMCEVQLDLYLQPDKSFNSHSTHAPLKLSRTRLKLLGASEFYWKASWNGRSLLAAVSNAGSLVWILNFHNLLSGNTATARDIYRLLVSTYDAYYISKSSLSHVNMHFSTEKSI